MRGCQGHDQRRVETYVEGLDLLRFPCTQIQGRLELPIKVAVLPDVVPHLIGYFATKESEVSYAIDITLE